MEQSTQALYGVSGIVMLWVIIAVIVFSITYSQSTTHPRAAEPLMWGGFISSAICLVVVILLTLNDPNIFYTFSGVFLFVFFITLMSVVFGSMPPAWKGLIPATVASMVTLFLMLGFTFLGAMLS